MSMRHDASLAAPVSILPESDPRMLDAQVRAAQTDMMIERSRTSNLFGVPVAFVVGWVLWGAIAPVLVAGWVAAKVLVTAWRVWITLQYDRGDRDDLAQTYRQGRRFILALWADGFVFGLLGTALMPSHDPALAATMIATLLGIAALALVILSMNLEASLALTVPTLLPGMLYQFSRGDKLSLFTGLGMGIFLVLVVIEGRQAAAHTRAMLRLRYQMDELALQRKQALALAERNSEVKSQFLATMSHEMRTPLHGVLGLARLLQAEGARAGPQWMAERLQTLERTGEHLLGIINDVLDYSKIEGGHLRPEPHRFDLMALLNAVSELSSVSAAEKGLALRLSAALPNPCWVTGDSARMRQVLLNLTGNAVKFTSHGHITLSVRRELGRPTAFELSDTGPGVAPDQRESIFNAFQQADNSFARRHGGTGLGLTISRALARAMGGELVCVDRAGPGSSFLLTLPLPDAEAPAITAAAPDSRASTAEQTPVERIPATLTGNVLLVEDNPVNALVAEALLQRMGITVDLVTDGEQAVECAQAGRHHLILMDCQMPGIDGFEATARIRARERASGRHAVPIVALTANALQGDRERSLASGMNDHLAKPFREAELLDMLRRYLPG